LPCLGNHEVEFNNGAEGFDSYFTRYTLPDNGTEFPGRWYGFRVGAALFLTLDADDVIYQDSGAFVAGPAPLVPAPSIGHAAIAPGTSLYLRGYSGGAQTRWLEATLRAAAADRDIDWIVVQMHQDALSSSAKGNGSDKGIREAWLPLFDRYDVDLVLRGHDHDYERSWPVRGLNRDAGKDAATGAVVETLQPNPVVSQDPADATFETGRSTIHLILGGGGTSAPLDAYGVDPARHAAGQGVHQGKPADPGRRPRDLHAPRRRCRGGRHLVGPARHQHRLRHRSLRPRPRPAGRQDHHHDALLSRARRHHSGQGPPRLTRGCRSAEN
jgi:hypothetical protein